MFCEHVHIEMYKPLKYSRKCIFIMAKAGIIPTTTQPQHNTSLGIYGFSVSYQFTLVFTLGFFPSSILDSDICKNTSLRSRQR